jgi:hypothetical protein
MAILRKKSWEAGSDHAALYSGRADERPRSHL